MKTLTTEEYKQCQALGLMTGSWVIGGATENSDVDIVMTDKNFYTIFDTDRANFLFGENLVYLTQEPYIEAPDNFQSVKALYRGVTVNLIIVTNQLLFDGWRYATQFMLFLGKTHPINLNRRIRQLFFELIKLSYVRATQYLEDPKTASNYTPRLIGILFNRKDS